LPIGGKVELKKLAGSFCLGKTKLASSLHRNHRRGRKETINAFFNPKPATSLSILNLPYRRIIMSKNTVVKAANRKAPVANKSVKTALKVVRSESNTVAEKGREFVLATVGAAAIVRKQGEKLVANFFDETAQIRNRATKLATNVVGDVQEQANGVLAQVKSAAAANLGWVGEKAQDQMGKVLNRIGVPSKADVNELSRRVADLHKQVKALKKAA
jgi:poly(hydroxyalkanoate) granule-associated protein